MKNQIIGILSVALLFFVLLNLRRGGAESGGLDTSLIPKSSDTDFNPPEVKIGASLKSEFSNIPRVDLSDVEGSYDDVLETLLKKYKLEETLFGRVVLIRELCKHIRGDDVIKLFGAIEDPDDRLVLIKTLMDSDPVLIDGKMAGFTNSISEANDWSESILEEVSGFDAASQFIERNMTGARKRDAIYRSFNRFVDDDVEGALALLKDMDPGSFHDFAYSRVGMKMFKSNGAVAALEWADSIKDVKARKSTMQSIASMWVGLDLKSVVEFRDSVANPGDRKIFNAMLASAFSRKDLKAGMEWAETLEPTEQGRVYELLFQGLVRENPEAAAKRLSGLKLNSRPLTNIRYMITSEWVKSDPKPAIEWIEGWEEGGERDQVLVKAAGRYVTELPSQASKWIRDLPEGNVRDNAIRMLIQLELDDLPVDAAYWVLEIENEGLKRSLGSMIKRGLAGTQLEDVNRVLIEGGL